MSDELIGQDQAAVLGDESVPGGGADEKREGAPDLKTRVMSGGDFAWEQIQLRDRQNSELASRAKKLEPVEQLVNFAGGDTNRLFQLTDLGNRVLQVPGLLDVVQSAIRNGRVEPSNVGTQTGQEDEEWMDPDAKKVQDRLTEKISSLESRIGELTRVASTAELRANEQRIEANINRALKDFEGDKDAFVEASKAIQDRYKSAYRMAEQGDATQAKLLDQLASENGAEILDVITGPIFRKHAAKLVAASQPKTPNDATATQRRATDERTVNPSRPELPPLTPRPKGRVSDEYVLKTFQEIARRKGIDPSVLR